MTPSFTGAALDRAAELRMDVGRVAERLGEGDAVALFSRGTDVVVDADRARLARTSWSGDPATAILLGIEEGRPLVAVDLADGADGRATAPGTSMMALREAGTALGSGESGLAAYLVALLNWHRRHPCCSVCGTRTEIAEAGLSRVCPSCSATHFPRTDPVVIMTVESEGRLLMGSRVGWPDERYSVLAGFVASAETPEEAVIREVAEESGIVARDPRYVMSQPWPFPASLMLGFHAVADGGEPRPGGDDELSDVRWFTREEVMAMQRGESPLQLPPEVSIARLLIDRWVSR